MAAQHVMTVPPRAAVALRTLGAIVECIIVAALVALALEGLSRLFHLGVRPMLPFVMDEAQGSRMPGHFDSKVKFPGMGPFRVCTDAHGLRVPDCDSVDAGTSPLVLTVGDSQAFGWGMAFADTFTAHVAHALDSRAEGSARIMAAGAADVESLLPWARDYRSAVPQARTRLNLVVVNLGNDLDEMYFGRSTGSLPMLKAVREWLTVHSYFMLDFTLAKNSLFDVSEWQLPPGANPVVVALRPDEQQQLAVSTASATLRLVHALPPAEQTVVVLLPTDYQIAAGEFAKYRKFYRTQAQFDGWQRRVGDAAAVLDQVEADLRERLAGQGVRIVAPRERLKGLDSTAVFDRSSHHYTPLGHKVLAQAILQEIGR